MFDFNKLSLIVLELQNSNNIGCTFDFKERHNVSLTTLEALGLIMNIKTRIPKCDDHCTKYTDCQWIPIYEKQKSKSKFKLTKTGEKLANELNEKKLKDDEIKSLIKETISKTILIDTIQSLIIEHKYLTTEKMVMEILKQTNITLEMIRTTLRDILNLMESLLFIRIKEGLFFGYV